MSNANENTPAIDFRVEDGIAVATMARPKQRNALTPEFLACMHAIIADLKGRSDVDALIITGTDGVFCAGGDIKGMVERHKAGGAPAEEIRRRLYAMHDWVQPLRNLEIPVIAAVDGPAYGAGFAIALCADFVLASDRARFCSVFCRIGLIPDCGVLYTLPRAIGLQRAKELMYTGRPVDAAEAKDLGIAMEVHPADALLGEAMALARRMQHGSRTAFGVTKRIANQSLDIDAIALIEMEAAGQAVCMDSPYHGDAVDRFVGKQPLKFNWEAEDAAA